VSGDETPSPPKTPAFGYVTPDGPVHRYGSSEGATITKRSVGGFDNDVYLVRCDATGEALLIDGAARFDLLVDLIGDATLVAVAQTHGHHDHVQALRELVERYQVPVYASTGDDFPVPTVPVGDGETLSVGNLSVEIMLTPGHTPGSTCYLLGGFLFSGDTLFPGGPGNTFGSKPAFKQLMGQVDRLFATLDDRVKILPGHGVDSTIGRERPHVETWRRRGW
jgi:glyoxylase-like metal-dependent hydrolase (beta-lactamase superfamily II)